MATGSLNYFEVQDLTAELVARLQAFIAGEQTHASLASWAREVWGDTQEGPVASNQQATAILMNAWNAEAEDEASGPVLRTEDAAAYILSLRRGVLVPPTVEVGGLKAPLQVYAERLGLATERHVIDGLGWFEVLQFASLGTGRVFILQQYLGRGPLREQTLVGANQVTDASEVVRDLFETLGIDLADVKHFDRGFDVVTLPRWALYQDDRGARTTIASFTGLRKAEEVLRQFEGSPHGMRHWLEPVVVALPAAESSALWPMLETEME